MGTLLVHQPVTNGNIQDMQISLGSVIIAKAFDWKLLSLKAGVKSRFTLCQDFEDDVKAVWQIGRRFKPVSIWKDPTGDSTSFCKGLCKATSEYPRIAIAARLANLYPIFDCQPSRPKQMMQS